MSPWNSDPFNSSGDDLPLAPSDCLLTLFHACHAIQALMGGGRCWEARAELVAPLTALVLQQQVEA